MISRSASLRFRQEFEVSLGEWRTLALVGAEQAMSLNNLARAANLDKGQMSRVVSSLVARGLIARKTAGEGRTVDLSLTRQGEQLHRRLMRVAGERNLAFLACLTDVERAALETALPKLHALARALCHGPAARPRGTG
ncbi:MarR family winged helix-turn-helix transcriptional regulator [Enterovirga rhinocerotis]|nr:MarR family transcriptional regulator [Enterovirga rhinocerotis]